MVAPFTDILSLLIEPSLQFGWNQTVIVEDYIDGAGYMSVTADWNHVSLLYDANEIVSCMESQDGGLTFGDAEILATDSTYSHIRIDSANDKLIAAYAKFEDGNYNIYVRIK